MFESGCKIKMDQLYCLTWLDNQKRDKLWNSAFCNLNNIFVDINKHLPDKCSKKLPSLLDQKDTWIFPLSEAISINTCFHNWKHWLFFNPTGGFSPLLVLFAHWVCTGGLLILDSPTIFHYDRNIQTSFKLQQRLQRHVNYGNEYISLLNYTFPCLWFYSHICQFRHFICRMWYFLSNVHLKEAFWRRGEMFSRT